MRLPDLPAEIRDLLGGGHHVAGRPAGEDAVHLRRRGEGRTENHGEPRKPWDKWGKIWEKWIGMFGKNADKNDGQTWGNDKDFQKNAGKS